MSREPRVDSSEETVLKKGDEFIGFTPNAEGGWAITWGLLDGAGQPRPLVRTSTPLRVSYLEGVSVVESVEVPFDTVELVEDHLTADAEWRDSRGVLWRVRAVLSRSCPGFSLDLDWSLVDGAAEGVTFQLSATAISHPATSWSFIPGLLYNGNRADVVVDRRYMPQLHRDDMAALAVAERPVRVTTVIPRLDADTGYRLDMLARDAATPELAVLDLAANGGFFFGGPVDSTLGPVGLAFVADPRSGVHELSWSLPGVRPRRYAPCDWTASPDRPASLRAGDTVNAAFTVHSTGAKNVGEFLRAFREVQDGHRGSLRVRSLLPWSAANALIRNKFDEINWQDDPGFYRRRYGPQPIPSSLHLQMGWIDGMSTVFCLLGSPDERTRQRAAEMLRFVLTGQARSGLSYGAWDGVEWVSHYPGKSADAPGTMVRRTTSSVYWALRIAAMDPQLLPADLLEELDAFSRRSLLALQKLWRENDDLGFLLDPETGRILWRGTACGAIAPAVLATGSARFNDPSMLGTAVQIAERYQADFVDKGDCYGGPNDVLCATDNESGFELVESFVTLFEQTGQEHHLQAACAAVDILATWLLTRTPTYPQGSFFDKLGIDAFGAMTASTQNLVGTPGLCISSGSFLLRLYEHTGDERHVRLLEAILRVVPQMIVTKAGQWRELPVGTCTELLNFGDTYAPPGETVMFEATWIQQVLMAAELELPGVYVDTGRQLVATFDHVDALLDGDRLEVTNPTAYDALVCIKVRDRSAVTQRLTAGERYVLDLTAPAAGKI